MPKEIVKEEQVDKSSEEKTKEQTEEPSEISDVEDGVAKFSKAQAEKLAKETKAKDTEKKESSEEECKTCESVSEEELETKESPFSIVDKDGNKTPLIFKAGGKEYIPDSVEKAITWGNLGVHANTELEKIKQEREEYEKAKPFIPFMQELDKAFREGRLTFDGKPIKQEEGTETEEKEEEESLDPEMVAMKKELKELKEKGVKKEEIDMKERILKQYDSLTSEIETHTEKNFAAVVESAEDHPPEVWGLLGKTVKAKDGDEPKYTVEEAMKLSHDAMLKAAKKLVKEHPEEFKEFIPDKDAIYAEKVKEKQDLEEAPVSPPSEMPAETKTAKKKIKDVADGVEQFSKMMEDRRRAAEKI